MHLFNIETSKLVEVARLFASRVGEGLREEGREVPCLLTYVPTLSTVPDGAALVVDLGGTRVRAAMVHCTNGVLEVHGEIAEALLPLERGVPLARERYMQTQVEVVRRLAPPSGLPLGYCFSYPSASLPDGDATLIGWTKGVNIPDVEGHAVGLMLQQALALAGITTGGAVVLNDTVAALLAGLSGPAADYYAGLIVGTGNNIALRLTPETIPRFPSIPWSGPIAVNLESGNFNPGCLNRFDDGVDQASENPGRQRFEKAVSGVYLGRLLKEAGPELVFNPDSGSQGVAALACSLDPEVAGIELAQAILNRSSDLVAASVAGAALVLSGGNAGTVRLIAEGGLYWGAPGYHQRVCCTLNSLLAELGMEDVTVDIQSRSSANLLGAGVAALSRTRRIGSR